MSTLTLIRLALRRPYACVFVFISRLKELTKLTEKAYRNSQLADTVILRLTVNFKQRELSL